MNYKTLRLHLVSFIQEATRMYTGVMTVQEILDHTDAAISGGENNKTGYQREANNARATDLARYLKENPKPLVPTALLFSYRKAFGSEADTYGRVTVEITEGEKLWVIDGQQRIAGFKTAIDKYGIKRLRDYSVPVVIIEQLALVEEAYQFMMLNDTSKNSRTDLDRKLRDPHNFSQFYADGRFLEASSRDWETRTAAICKALNASQKSPWYGRIQMGEEPKTENTVVRELTFIQSLKELGTNKAFKKNSSEEVTQLLTEYWLAWKTLVPDGFKYADKHMLMKSAGLNICHILLVEISKENSPSSILQMKAADFTSLLKTLAELPASTANTHDPAKDLEEEEEEEEDLDDTNYLAAQYWRSDSFKGAAVVGSSKGHKLTAKAMANRLYYPKPGGLS